MNETNQAKEQLTKERQFHFIENRNLLHGTTFYKGKSNLPAAGPTDHGTYGNNTDKAKGKFPTNGGGPPQ